MDKHFKIQLGKQRQKSVGMKMQSEEDDRERRHIFCTYFKSQCLKSPLNIHLYNQEIYGTQTNQPLHYNHLFFLFINVISNQMFPQPNKLHKPFKCHRLLIFFVCFNILSSGVWKSHPKITQNRYFKDWLVFLFRYTESCLFMCCFFRSVHVNHPFCMFCLRLEGLKTFFC